MKSTRVFQLTTLALVLVSVVQVGWWLFDQRSYAHGVGGRRTPAAYAEQTAAAQALLDAGTDPPRVQALLPKVVVSDGRAALAPAVDAALANEEAGRQRQVRLGRRLLPGGARGCASR